MHFSLEPSYGYLRFEGNGRPRWQNWLGLHSVNSMVVGSNLTASNNKFCYFLSLPFPIPSFFPTFPKEFPISFKPKVAIARSNGKCKIKPGTGGPLLMLFFETLEKQPSKQRSDLVLKGQMRVPK